MDRYERAGGRYLVCPICVNSKKIDSGTLITGAELGGTVPLWQWIDDGATTFSFWRRALVRTRGARAA